MGLHGKVAIVTGAGSGIGRAISQKFVQEKACVAVVDLNGEAAVKVAEEAKTQGGIAFPIAADISKSVDVSRMVETVLGKFGHIDILVNNAAIRYVRRFLEHSLIEWQHTIDVNLTGPYLCTQAVIPHLLNKGKGKIINVASVAGLVGRPHRAAYCASKGGLIALTKAVAADMHGKNICINALAPALIDTPLNANFSENLELAPTWGSETLIGRWGQPAEVAEAALFLASDASDFITGAVLTIDGGWTAAKIRANEF